MANIWTEYQPSHSNTDYQEAITEAGWQIKSMEPSEDGKWSAIATDGQRTVERFGDSPDWALSHILNYIVRLPMEQKTAVYPSLPGVPGEDSSNKAPRIGEADPNAGWESNHIDPNVPPIQPGSEEDKAKLNAGHVQDAANSIDTEWYKSNDPNVWKQAVLNAFRVAILSPRKNFNWNAVHYQQVRDMPVDATGSDYFRRLEGNRRRWNAARGHDPLGHIRFSRELRQLTKLVQQQHPDQYSKEDAEGVALGVVSQLVKEAETALLHSAMQTPARFDPESQQWKKKKPTSLGLMSSAYDAVKDQLSSTLRGPAPDTNDTKARLDQLGLESQLNLPDLIKQAAIEYRPDNRENYEANDPNVIGDPEKNPGKYGAFIYEHLDAMSEIGNHINDLAKAAHDDAVSGGSGHLFRNTVMRMNIRGVNPKVCSFVWLLLAPKTSELGTMDTHMTRALTGSQETGTYLPGIDDNTAGNPLHYYGMERSLKAMRDKMGYQNVPLGQFQWMMWDKVRGGHSDHRSVSVLDNKLLPHSELPWLDTPTRKTDPQWHPEEWMKPAMDARTQAWIEYQQQHGGAPISSHPDPSNPIPHPGFDPLNPSLRPGQSAPVEEPVLSKRKKHHPSHGHEHTVHNWFNHGSEHGHAEYGSHGNHSWGAWGYWAPIGYGDYNGNSGDHPSDNSSGDVASDNGGGGDAAGGDSGGGSATSAVMQGVRPDSEGARTAATRAFIAGLSVEALNRILNSYVQELDPILAKRFRNNVMASYADFGWDIDKSSLVKSATYRFVFYKGQLEVEPEEDHASYRHMIENILRLNNKTMGDYDVEGNDVATGKIDKTDNDLHVELESLANDETQHQALEAVQKWHDNLYTTGPIQPSTVPGAGSN